MWCGEEYVVRNVWEKEADLVPDPGRGLGREDIDPTAHEPAGVEDGGRNTQALQVGQNGGRPLPQQLLE